MACREDVDTLTLATNLTQQDNATPGGIVAGLRPSSQLKRLISVQQPLPGVVLYDLVALGYSADVVLGGRLDEAARSIHEAYYRRQIAAGKKQGETPAIMPWENLPAGIRQANRSQADRIPIKRRMLEISRTEETIGSLAESEHRRWVAERTWRSGDTQPRGTMLAAAFSSFAPTRNSGRRSGRRTATR